MSNALAVAAATRTLKVLLARATPNVTTLPLDQARDSSGADQLNLFLYQTVLAAAWRNADPVGLRPGESGVPPLPLSLHYLVTAYADDEANAHAVLGQAMSVLHDHAVLGAQEIRDATLADLPRSDLHLQPERVRITPLPLSTDDMFKLWSGFQTNYRLSAAYEVSVVLVDSTQPATSPPPVLRQGAEDRGPLAVASPAPVLTSVVPVGGAPVAALGGTLRLIGSNLDAPVSAVRFSNPRLAAPIDLVPSPAVAAERTVVLPAGSPAIMDWVPGLYTVALVSSVPGIGTWVGNEVPVALGATITVAPLSAPPGDLVLTVTCAPRPRADQRVMVIFGDRQVVVAPGQVAAPADPALPSTLTVPLTGVGVGTYLVRLRVDGADSDPTSLAGSPPRPGFSRVAQVVVA